ncbi:uncharacterized protein LOC116306621 [Actinia tenebrosa]|uniref:Uncharacterized protein LOC116306621 n=1 Tax=Actinia tenebrosa TaxID=6105 RepID=A0A6P8IZE7_ACTTE|nr:uncharacterized protein LOC116306621 [Actinia tenebrosa]
MKRRRFVADTYVIEVAVRQGDPGELYEDGHHKVYVRREGSVEGPLSPVKIKELVLQNIKEVLNERKRKRIDESLDETTKEQSTGPKDKTPTNQQPIKKAKLSPIVFDLKDTDRVI